MENQLNLNSGNDNEGKSELTGHFGPLQAPIAFGTHAVSSALTLLIIGAVAIGLGFAIDWLEMNGKASPWIILGLKGGEYFLFALEMFLLAVFALRTARREMPKL